MNEFIVWDNKENIFLSFMIGFGSFVLFVYLGEFVYKKMRKAPQEKEVKDAPIKGKKLCSQREALRTNARVLPSLLLITPKKIEG